MTVKLNVEEALRRLSEYKYAVLSSSELAFVFGISKSAITQRGNRGSLPKHDFYLGKRRIWGVDTVREWLFEKDGLQDAAR